LRLAEESSYAPPMVYQHPLAYLLGLEGVALLRAFSGDYDRGFTDARFAEMRTLLDSVDKLGEGVDTPLLTTADGYNSWSEDYDEPGNGLIDLEQPIVQKILAGLPVGVALDAACGTGRHAAYLASLGHDVIGVDSSPGMLDRARAKVPGAKFYDGDLHDLPVPDDHVDVVVCALALTHVPDLPPVLVEFARVLRPGGHLVISESPGLMTGGIGFPLVKRGPDGMPGLISNRHHRTSDYLAAALPLGLQVRHCEEPRLGYPTVDPDDKPPENPVPTKEPPDIWSLHCWTAAATNAAYRDQPVAIIWDFQLSPPAAGIEPSRLSFDR
jgi:SAM-dependent methyltransferase